MNTLTYIAIWVSCLLLPLFYLSLLFQKRMPWGFKDNLTLLNALLLLPLAVLAGKVWGNEAINGIQVLRLTSEIINILDFWVAVSMFVASLKFHRPGLAIAGLMLFSLAVRSDLFANKLVEVLFALLSFSIGFSERLRDTGWNMFK